MAKKIRIIVADEVATVAGHRDPIVCGNEDYEVEFTFDEAWDDHPVKTARFISNGKITDVVFEGTTVAVPKLYNTTQVSIGVYSGETKTTTAAVLRCMPSAVCPGGVPEEPTPDVYGQLIDLINNGLGGGGGGGASWPKPERVTADTRITEEGYYYAYAAFSGVESVVQNFGVFYFKPYTTMSAMTVATVYAGHSARLTVSGDGKLTLSLITRTVNGTTVTDSFSDAGTMYNIYLTKLS